jgi:hypothetical protein
MQCEDIRCDFAHLEHRAVPCDFCLSFHPLSLAHLLEPPDFSRVEAFIDGYWAFGMFFHPAYLFRR